VARAADLLAHQRLNRSLDFAGAAYALEDAARRVRDPGTQSGLHARRVQVLLHAGQTSDAIDVAREVLASPAAPPGARLRAAQQASMALGLCGQETSAAEIWAAEYELALSVASSEPIVAVELLAARGICGLVAGRLVEVEAALADLHESAASNVFAHGWELLLRGRMALFRGDGGLAIASLGDAMIAHQEHPNGALLLYAKSLASEAHAMVGDVTSASAIVRTLGSTADMDHGPSTSDAKRALGWVPVANGETTAGSDMFIAAADRARSGGFRVPEMLALYDAIRVGERGAAMDRLLSVARACEGPLPSAVAAHVEALRRDRGKDLEAVSMAFEDNRMAVLAAEAASQAARAFARGGLRRREAEANARVDRLRHACREMRTPVLDAAMTPVSLTRREREVTRLAVQGLSSRVIAERLGVNVRTVDGHLYQVYGKLGVNGRAALARVWKTTEQNR
jgi:DNA-binding CsgD family transcriptional regulator